MIESSENGVVLTEEEIKEQVDTIMFEVSILRSITSLYLYLNFDMILRSIRLYTYSTFRNISKLSSTEGRQPVVTATIDLENL